MLGWIDNNLVSMVDGVAYGLLLFTLAVGLSLVFGMMDVLNLAHGTLYLVGAYAAYALSDGGWGGFFLALVVGLLVSIGIENVMTRFRGLRPQLCSIYKPYFWWHERYWKLQIVNLRLNMLNGTVFKPLVWRRLGVRMAQEADNTRAQR